MRRLLLGGVVALGVTVAWAGVGPTAASARQRHKRPSHIAVVAVGDTGTLSGDGLTVDVPVTITCRNATAAPIRLTLRQNSVTGSGHSGTDYKCNRRPQRLVISVVASSTSPFRRGTAMASASVTLHTTTGGTASTGNSRAVQLT